MNIAALVAVCILISLTYKIAYTVVEYYSRDKVEEFPKCQICTTGIPYVLWYKEDIVLPDMCHAHFKQSRNIDKLERELLDAPRVVPVPGMEHELMIERAGGFGRYRNTYIKPLPITARVLTSNDVREVEELPYEIVVDEYLGVIKHVPARPRAIAEPERF